MKTTLVIIATAVLVSLGLLRLLAVRVTSNLLDTVRAALDRFRR